MEELIQAQRDKGRQDKKEEQTRVMDGYNAIMNARFSFFSKPSKFIKEQEKKTESDTLARRKKHLKTMRSGAEEMEEPPAKRQQKEQTSKISARQCHKEVPASSKAEATSLAAIPENIPSADISESPSLKTIIPQRS